MIVVPERGRDPDPSPALVVGIGASAGGLEAFKRLLAALAPDTGLAFILVQHLDPKHDSLLSELLASRTRMPVTNAEQGARLEPDTVYVIRPDCALAVRNGLIELSEPTLHRGVRLPVDHLFRSLAREYGPRSVGIVLSGAGSDGSAGLRDIKSAGGLVIAQDPASGGQTGMPQSAIDTGLVDLVLSIDDIPTALERFTTLPPDASIDPSMEAEANGSSEHDEARQDAVEGRRAGVDGEVHGSSSAQSSSGAILDASVLTRLAAMLETRRGFDLRVYKRGTVDRRVLRRMALSGFDDVDAWLDHVRDSSDEQRILVRDLMISVTNFFRDAEAFEALREHVIGPLLARAAPGATVRVWVAGCATGEEAYSIGMELFDAAEARGLRIEPQIFATDVDRDALAVARNAVYPASIAERVSASRLERYFAPVEGRGFKVRSSLRDTISFASHDLTKDPPFSKMDLVSCRNVLIYLTPEAQAHVLGAVHFALQPDGHLLLSTSESVGSLRERYATVSKAARLYRKVGSSPIAPLARSRRRDPDVDADAAARSGKPEGDTDGDPRRRPAVDPMRSAVLQACVPPTIIVSGSDTVTFIHGELGPYLRFPQGDEPRLEIGKCLRPEIATRVRGALYRCRREGRTAVALTSPDEAAARVRVVARPAPSLGDDVVVLSFEPELRLDGTERAEQDSAQGTTIERAPDARDEGVAGDERLVEQLEYELKATREDLRSTVEELETSNEELRSSNEESMSMNEELQSGNEELEATTEELRSLNEELTTVNAQLREKLDQLEQANDDLGNFFASARVAVVFLDERLRISRFTPAAATLLGIDHVDVGRFTGDIARELLQDDLEHEAREVLDRLTPRTRELRTRDGRWFTRRILPYRTENRRIEGVVITLDDISELKRGAERLAARERQQAVIARLGLAALREQGLEEFMEHAVREVAAVLDLDLCKILELQPGGERLLLRTGIGWNEGVAGRAWVANDEGSQAGFTLASRVAIVVDDLAAETRFTGPDLLVDHDVTSGLSCVILDGSSPYGVLGAHTRSARRFVPEDAAFVQAVANVIGTAVSRHLNRRRMAVERDVTRALVSAEGLDFVLESLHSSVIDTLGVELVEVRGAHSCEPPGEALPDTLLHAGTPVPIEHRGDVVEQVLACGRAVWVTDIGAPPLHVGESATEQAPFRSAFGFPVRSRDRTLGVIALYARTRLIGNEPFLNGLEAIGVAISEFVARAELERRDARLAAITHSSQDAILSYDHLGRVTEWLQGAERLYGFTAKEMIGRPLDRMVPAGRLAGAASTRARVQNGERVEPFETQRLARDGRLIEVSVTVSPIRDRDGRITGISSIERDIGRLKRTERQLLAADQQKDEFLAMLGHELRNPLSSIRTATELLGLEDEGSAGVRRTREILERQTAHMARLLDGLLDVSRIVQGKIALDLSAVDLVGVCQEVLDDLADRLLAQRLELRVRLPGSPLAVHGDRVRLVQVVDNLLSNAIKYTPEHGTIDVELVRDGNVAQLDVRDTGVGIDSALLPHVFDVFRQSQRSLDRSGGGLGLGLSLVRALVGLHGGHVEARSDGEGRGAELRVRLPLTGEVTLGSDPGNIGGQASDLDIVLVEDNVDTADVLGRVLVRLGHRVRLAADGHTAIDMAIESAPDLMICDLGLPDGLSGYDVARTLRASPATGGVRLVALTGYGRPEDRSRTADAGFDEHLTKPVSLDQLRGMLARGHESM